MDDPREIYFPKNFRKHGASLSYTMSRTIPLSDRNISQEVRKCVREKIMRTMPQWIDNLHCKYTPNVEYAAPFIVECYRKYGYLAEVEWVGKNKEIGTVTLSFIHMPDIKNRFDIDMRVSYELECRPLHYKLIDKYLTPYVEEAYTIELLPKILPQPIAEAIMECIMGVIARRIHWRNISKATLDWTKAWDQEVYLTYADMFGALPHSIRIPSANSWEAAAIRMSLDDGW